MRKMEKEKVTKTMIQCNRKDIEKWFRADENTLNKGERELKNNDNTI
jgi:hypothetical protein